eukprot:761459-Hanusia_phi.AAC.2
MENTIYRSVGVWIDDPTKVECGEGAEWRTRDEVLDLQVPANKTRYAIGIFLPEGRLRRKMGSLPFLTDINEQERPGKPSRRRWQRMATR